MFSFLSGTIILGRQLSVKVHLLQLLIHLYTMISLLTLALEEKHTVFFKSSFSHIICIHLILEDSLLINYVSLFMRLLYLQPNRSVRRKLVSLLGIVMTNCQMSIYGCSLPLSR